MNSDTELVIEEIIESAETESEVYAQATNAWKEEDRAFRGMSREEVMSLVKRKLQLCGKF